MPKLRLANEAPRLALGAPGIRRMAVRRQGEVYQASTPQTGSMPQLQYRMASDDTGEWFEVGFTSLERLAGNSAAGWSKDRVYLDLQQSIDLVHRQRNKRHTICFS